MEGLGLSEPGVGGASPASPCSEAELQAGGRRLGEEERLQTEGEYMLCHPSRDTFERERERRE